MPSIVDTDELPKTIGQDGSVPESRMGNAMQVQDRVRQLIAADSASPNSRSQKRARVKGLVDGNPPYRNRDLVDAGTPERCNVNWRTAESYMSQGRSAYYDVFSEVPHYVSIRTKYGDPRKRGEFSKIITEEFDLLLKRDYSFDYHAQISQQEMLLYGCGPLMFEDTTDWRHTSILHCKLLVPEMAPSDVNQWDECAVLVDYVPHKLYKFIRNEETARSLGYDVTAVRKALMKASEHTQKGGIHNTWEWHQQQLKNNSFQYSAYSKVVQCAHYFVREFPDDESEDGRITHAIVLIAQGDEAVKDDSKGGISFLFKKVGRFENWRQLIHPMYLDNDGGGYHHSVTGLGVKMYPAMEAQNRLLCSAFDKAFAPKQLFKPTSAQAAETMNIVNLGDYGKVPRDWEAVQMPTVSFMDDVLILNRELAGMIAANLSQFRQNLSKDTGNPITAREAGLRASEQTRLSRTQLNHYFAQQDWLYEEKYRRAVSADLNENLPGGKEAKYFIKCCTDRGVPIEALRQWESVKSTRVIGQGSPFLRQEVMREMVSTSGINPSPAGRANILADYYASLAGVSVAERYLPQVGPRPEESDQLAVATLQIAAAKAGTPPVVSGSQDSAIFADAFLSAAGGALQSLEKGGDPMQVHQFLEILMPAAAQHIEAMARDPRLKKSATALQALWKRIASMADKLEAQIQKQQEQQQQAMMQRREAMARQNGAMSDQRLKFAESIAENRRKDAELAAEQRRREQAHMQDLAIADARAASEITISNRKAAQQNAEQPA